MKDIEIELKVDEMDALLAGAGIAIHCEDLGQITVRSPQGYVSEECRAVTDDPWTQQERDQGWRYVEESLRDPLVYASPTLPPPKT